MLLGPGFWFLLLGLMCMSMGPVAAVLAGAPRHPAKAAFLGLAAYLLGLSAGSALGWYLGDLITVALDPNTFWGMPEMPLDEPGY